LDLSDVLTPLILPYALGKVCNAPEKYFWRYLFAGSQLGDSAKRAK